MECGARGGSLSSLDQMITDYAARRTGQASKMRPPSGLPASPLTASPLKDAPAPRQSAPNFGRQTV